MSVSNVVVRQLYDANDVTTTFAIPFAYIRGRTEDIKVYKVDATTGVQTLQVEGAMQDYTLPPSPDPLNPDPVNVEFNTAPLDTDGYVLIEREMPLQQLVSYVNTGKFNAKDHEKAMDFIVMLVQQLKTRVDQTPQFNILDIADGFNTSVGRLFANGVVVVNETNDGFKVVTPTELAAMGGEINGASDISYDNSSSGLTATDVQAAIDELATISGSVGPGFSARFNENFTEQSLLDTVLQILDFSYLAPLISLSGSSNSIREKGTVVSGITLTAAVTKRSEDIAEVRFYDVTDGNTLLDTDTSSTESGNRTHNFAGSFSDTQQFRAEVDDTPTGTTVSSTVTYTFVYPYYYGAEAAGLAAADVPTDLSKSIITSNANYTRTFAPDGTEVLYFAYPASYGALTAIYDVNNFNTIADWTQRTENVTGLDGNPVSYYIYEFNNVPLAGSYDYRFVR